MWWPKSTREFWVVFDTSQYQKYYQDVHNVVAAPSGHILRYEYREPLLTPRALELARAGPNLPVLLMYAQKNVAYVRGDRKSEVPPGTYDTIFVATRIAKMVNVVRQGEAYYFDFEVTGYPDNSNSQAVSEILQPLSSANEVPFSKWVATSQQVDALSALSRDDGQNWNKLIDSLAQSPMQFSADAFWKVSGPFTREGRKLAHHHVVQKGGIAQVSSIVKVSDRRLFFVQITSSIPKAVPPNRPEYQVELSITNSDVLKSVGNNICELRHYTTKNLEYHSEDAPIFGSTESDLMLATKPESSWPAGASISIRHRITKSVFVVLLGILCGVASVLFVVIGGSKLFENDVLNGTVILAIGALLGAASKYMLTGKLEFSKP